MSAHLIASSFFLLFCACASNGGSTSDFGQAGKLIGGVGKLGSVFGGEERPRDLEELGDAVVRADAAWQDVRRDLEDLGWDAGQPDSEPAVAGAESTPAAGADPAATMPAPASAPAPEAGPGGPALALAERELELAHEAPSIEQAEEHLRRSLAHHPTCRAHNNLGVIHHRVKGEPELARAHYEAALAIDPAYGPAAQNLADLAG